MTDPGNAPDHGRPVGAGRTRRAPRRHPVAVDLAVLTGGVGLGAVIAQWLLTMPSIGGMGEVRGAATSVSVGDLLLAAGQITGLVAAYLALVGLLLASRVPVIESALGLDRMLRTHRRLGPWTIGLMLAHPVLVTFAYAAGEHTNPVSQAWTIVWTYEYVWLAAAGLTVIVVAGLSSWHRLRSRMRYETWWLLHLSMYAGVAGAFLHQLSNGAAFIGHPLARALWIAGYVAAFGCLALFRIGLPLARSGRYRLRVESVHREAPGIVSLVLRGEGLDRLRMAGGQFALWRFLAPGMWWQAHPYSVSGLPAGDRIRLTVRNAGDHSGGLRRLRTGTRVLMEGPYGAFTAAARHRDRRTLLIAGGVGIVPIRTLMEDLTAPGAARGVGPTPDAATHHSHRQGDGHSRSDGDGRSHSRSDGDGHGHSDGRSHSRSDGDDGRGSDPVPQPDPVLLYRVHRERDLLFRGELAALAGRGGRVEPLIGDRHHQPMTADRIRALVPDAGLRDWYVCGPPDLLWTLLDSARRMGVPASRVHLEAFDLHAAAPIVSAGREVLDAP